MVTPQSRVPRREYQNYHFQAVCITWPSIEPVNTRTRGRQYLYTNDAVICINADLLTCNGELQEQICVNPTISVNMMVAYMNSSVVIASFCFNCSATCLGNIWFSSVPVRFFSLLNAFVLDFKYFNK